MSDWTDASSNRRPIRRFASNTELSGFIATWIQQHLLPLLDQLKDKFQCFALAFQSLDRPLYKLGLFPDHKSNFDYELSVPTAGSLRIKLAIHQLRVLCPRHRNVINSSICTTQCSKAVVFKSNIGLLSHTRQASDFSAIWHGAKHHQRKIHDLKISSLLLSDI